MLAWGPLVVKASTNVLGYAVNLQNRGKNGENEQDLNLIGDYQNRSIAAKNLLLACLPRDVYARIEPELKALSLKTGHVLHRPGDQINDLYFPTTCMISVTVRVAGAKPLRWTRLAIAR